MPENRRKRIEYRPATITYDKKVAIYCRVSTKSDAQTNSLESQKYGLSEKVRCNPDWKLVAIYEDEYTGRNKFRPGFHKMMLDSYENRFDTILVKSISRFGRNVIDVLEAVKKLDALDIEVMFELENTDMQQSPKIRNFKEFSKGDGVCLVFKFIKRYATILNETALHKGFLRFRIVAFLLYILALL